MKKHLVIVESPTKAKTISQFLTKDFIVYASYGHLRDLPQSSKDIPKEYSDQAWAKIGVNTEKNFEPLYVLSKGKNKIIQQLKKALQEADTLYLATDEDREGESISWHLLEVLKPKIPVKRLVFHEITKKAILESLNNTRDLDLNLVKAQETRRVLDRLVGYTLSPLLWQKISYGLSAGRVQSPGLRMIIERERERLKFRSAHFTSLKISFQEGLVAELKSYQNFKVAQSKDFNPDTGQLHKPQEFKSFTKEELSPLIEKLHNKKMILQEVQEDFFETHPKAPFITSTLQQDSFRKLHLGAKETMRLAQKLYEEGLITYMRTDSPFLSQESLDHIYTIIKKNYGAHYLKPRVFTAKGSAQEAHEAIRPAGDFIPPSKLRLDQKALDLYTLIWNRTLSSQMISAQKKSLKYLFQEETALFQAQGSKIIEPGFLKCYQEDLEDPIEEFKKGTLFTCTKSQVDEHQTKPPTRFNEASLIQKLEKEGIGRPSTYATIISTLLDRGYVQKQKEQLVPSFIALSVIYLLEEHFPQLVDYDFTSRMESSLDDIAENQLDSLQFLKKFYLGEEGLQAQVMKKAKNISALEFKKVKLPLPKNLEIRLGKYGAFLHDLSDQKDYSLPEEFSPSDCRPETLKEWIDKIKKGRDPLGSFHGEACYLLQGPYGPYLQCGNKRVSIPKILQQEEINLTLAGKLLSLPKILGEKEGSSISLQVGPFGPYLKWKEESRSLNQRNFLDITLEEAYHHLQQPKGTRRKQSQVLKTFSAYKKKKVSLYEGPYGLYLKLGTKNITLPEDLRKKDLSEEEVKIILKNFDKEP